MKAPLYSIFSQLSKEDIAIGVAALLMAAVAVYNVDWHKGEYFHASALQAKEMEHQGQVSHFKD